MDPQNYPEDGLDRHGDGMMSQVVGFHSGVRLGAVRSLEQDEGRATATVDEEGEDAVFYEDGEAPGQAEGRSLPLFIGSKEMSAEPQRGELSLLKAKTDTTPDGGDTGSTGLLNDVDIGLLQDTQTQPQKAPKETLTQGTSHKHEQPHPGKETWTNRVPSACQERAVKRAPESTAPLVLEGTTQQDSKPETPSSPRDDGGRPDEAVENTNSRSQDSPARPCYSGEKPSDQNASSKYDTVCYRKIRKGNTRQKIDEFESMMIDM